MVLQSTLRQILPQIHASTSELIKITVDPDKETADIDTSNNSWPKEIKQSKFDQFKTEVKN